MLALLLACLTAFPPTAATRVEEPRPEIARIVADLDAAVAKNGKEDARAVASVDQLAALYEKCTPEERETIAKQVGRALRDPRARPDKKSHEDKLARAAARALGAMGEAGAKELAPALELKHFRVNGPLTEETAAELGRTRAKAAIAPLLEMAGTRSAFCLRGAARGAEHWGEADGATRKKLFEALLKPMQSLADEARSGTGASDAKEVFEGSRDAIYAALAALSHDAESRTIDGWQSWWNDNKNKSWDPKKR